MSAEKILIVEDEAEMLNLLEIDLKAEGYEVLKSSDGIQALKVVRSQRPALILLDVMMPGMSGMEVLRTLKSDKSTEHIPVIMLTAKGLETDVKEGLSNGAFSYISKPFQAEKLFEKIREALDKT